MTMIRVPSTAQAQTWVLRVTDTISGADPTSGTCEFQAVAPGTEPPTTGWAAGTWITGPTGTHYAAVQLSGTTPGGGDVEMAEGTWDLWLRLVAAGDSFPRRVASVVVT